MVRLGMSCAVSEVRSIVKLRARILFFACPNNDARGGRLARVASVGLLAGAVGLALAIQGTPCRELYIFGIHGWGPHKGADGSYRP